MAGHAGDPSVQARQREVRLRVVETRRARPAGLIVARGAVRVRELATVRIVRLVAAFAPRIQAQVRASGRTGGRLEPEHDRVRDEGRPMARSACGRGMRRDQAVPRVCVVEPGRIEPHDSELAAVMLGMAVSAVRLLHAAVQALSGRNPHGEGLVAAEALGRGDAPLAQSVAARAAGDAFERLVRGTQLSG
jgi:hypothetical protein